MKQLLCLVLLWATSAYTIAQQLSYFDTELVDPIVEADLPNWIVTTFGSEYSVKDITKKSKRMLPIMHRKYQILYCGIKIDGCQLCTHLSNGRIKSINGCVPNHIDIAIRPSVDSESALETILHLLDAKVYSWQTNDFPTGSPLSQMPQGELTIFPYQCDKDEWIIRLAYRFDIYAVEPESYQTIFVDAQTNTIVGQRSLIYDALGSANTRYSGTQTLYTRLNNGKYILHDQTRGDGIHTYNLNHYTSNFALHRVDFKDNDNNWTTAEYHNGEKDDAALDAHWAAIKIYDYFHLVHGRYGYDDEGAELILYVHYGNGYDNATWNMGKNVS